MTIIAPASALGLAAFFGIISAAQIVGLMSSEDLRNTLAIAFPIACVYGLAVLAYLAGRKAAGR